MDFDKVNYIAKQGFENKYDLIFYEYKKRFKNLSYNFFNKVDDDFIQECMISLISSIKKYDKTKGKFTSYFEFILENIIKKYKNENINYGGRLSRSVVERIESNKDKHLALNFSNTYTFSELSQIDEEGNEVSFEPYSLNDDLDINLMLYDLEKILSVKEFIILKLKYKKYNQQEIAELLFMSQQAVSKHMIKIREKVSEYLK